MQAHSYLSYFNSAWWTLFPYTCFQLLRIPVTYSLFCLPNSFYSLLSLGRLHLFQCGRSSLSWCTVITMWADCLLSLLLSNCEQHLTQHLTSFFLDTSVLDTRISFYSHNNCFTISFSDSFWSLRLVEEAEVSSRSGLSFTFTYDCGESCRCCLHWVPCQLLLQNS